MDWIVDYLNGVFNSATWKGPIEDFVEKNCVAFEGCLNREESPLSHTEIHLRYKDVVENLLEAHLQQVGLSQEEFLEVCAILSADASFYAVVMEPLLAVDDYLLFRKLMTARCLELEIAAAGEELRMRTKLSKAEVSSPVLRKRLSTKHVLASSPEELSVRVATAAATALSAASYDETTSGELLDAISESILSAEHERLCADYEVAMVEAAIAASLAMAEEQVSWRSIVVPLSERQNPPSSTSPSVSPALSTAPHTPPTISIATAAVAAENRPVLTGSVSTITPPPESTGNLIRASESQSATFVTSLVQVHLLEEEDEIAVSSSNVGSTNSASSSSASNSASSSNNSSSNKKSGNEAKSSSSGGSSSSGDGSASRSVPRSSQTSSESALPPMLSSLPPLSSKAAQDVLKGFEDLAFDDLFACSQDEIHSRRLAVEGLFQSRSKKAGEAEETEEHSRSSTRNSVEESEVKRRAAHFRKQRDLLIEKRHEERSSAALLAVKKSTTAGGAGDGAVVVDEGERRRKFSQLLSASSSAGGGGGGVSSIAGGGGGLPSLSKKK